MSKELNFDLPDEKIKECKEIFDLFDKDHDGCITTNELGPTLRVMGTNPTVEELKDMGNKVDINSTGKITFREVLCLYDQKRRNPTTEAEILEAFEPLLDKDGSGEIRIGELRSVMTKLGDKLTEEEVEDMIHEADPTGQKESFKLAEFVKVLMTK